MRLDFVTRRFERDEQEETANEEAREAKLISSARNSLWSHFEEAIARKTPELRDEFSEFEF